MASSKTVICNMALGNLGVGVEVADVDTERSAEARACRRFFDESVRATLRDFPWSFASVYEVLGMIEEDPNDYYGYSYTYPTTCLRPIKIMSGIRNDKRSTRVHYEISYGVSSTIIFTDQQEAVMKFVQNVTDVSRFPPDFVLALSWRLATYMAPKLTSGDPFKLKEHCMRMYFAELDLAKANMLNEQQVEIEPDCDLLDSRT